MKFYFKILALFITAFVALQWSSFKDAGDISIAERRKFERSSNAAIEKKIDDLLSQMTLEEKIGQMTQLNNSAIVTNANWGSGTNLSIEIKIDTAKLGKILRKYHVGSFLNGVAVPAETWY